MASTDYDFNLTRNQIIEAAYRKTGVLDSGEPLSGTEISEGNLALNIIIKDWRNKGIFLWEHSKKTQSLSASTSSYTLGNDVIHLEKAYYTSDNTDTPVEVISYSHYLDIRNKSSESSNPTHVALDYATSTRTLWVYPTPNASLTLTYLAVLRGKDLETANGNPQVPQELLRTLIYDLANDLADDVRLDLKERGYLAGKSEGLMMQAKRRDVEHETSPRVLSAFPRRRN